MTFNSLTFVLFFSLVLTFYYSTRKWNSRKWILLLSSYLFYAAWNPIFIVLLWLSTVVDWIAARNIAVAKGTSKRLWLLLSLSTNLGILAYFKYGGFLLENFSLFLEQFDILYAPPALSIVLPMGISFYTFQTLSYTIDIYRGKAEPAKHFLNYALYVTFFPQLVAGPIVRAVDFIPQCEAPKRPTADQFGWGCILLTLGLFQKNILADKLFAPVADQVFAEAMSSNFAAAWVGTLAFAGQVFCDFSGYSSCGIGAALCLGFALPDNFRFPYAAIGFSDFWRRWHISLSSWLRDYLYIPLGGNRFGSIARGRNLLFTMLLGGLWHGASWTFVAWGALHGLFLIGEVLLQNAFAHQKIWSRAPVQFLLGILTFLAVCLTWVLFRAPDFTTAFALLTAMFSPFTSGPLPAKASGALAGMTLLLIAHWRLRSTTLEALLARTPQWATSAAIALTLFSIFTLHGSNRGFIYFQF